MAEENCSAVLLEFKVARSRSKDRSFPGATRYTNQHVVKTLEEYVGNS